MNVHACILAIHKLNFKFVRLSGFGPKDSSSTVKHQLRATFIVKYDIRTKKPSTVWMPEGDIQTVGRSCNTIMSLREFLIPRKTQEVGSAADIHRLNEAALNVQLPPNITFVLFHDPSPASQEWLTQTHTRIVETIGKPHGNGIS